jgi:hypothetical protein
VVVEPVVEEPAAETVVEEESVDEETVQPDDDARAAALAAAFPGLAPQSKDQDDSAE